MSHSEEPVRQDKGEDLFTTPRTSVRRQPSSAAKAAATPSMQSLEGQLSISEHRLSTVQSTVEQLARDFQDFVMHSGRSHLAEGDPAASQVKSSSVPQSHHPGQLSQEFQATLQSLQQVLTADDVAVALAHRVLIEPPKAGAVADSLAASDSIPEAGDQSSGTAVGKLSRGRARNVVGATCFVGVVELAWQMHFRAADRFSARLQKAGAPAKAGLRILRGLVWAAAILIVARAARRSCFSIADFSCDRLCKLLEQRRAQKVIKEAEDDNASSGIQDGDFPA
ncbi:hypothetical protein WJX73_004811 [Symbiochloris irregularis]|uniref:Transmembrane protein n=1 Tax=Symbiochloris irregularis TaxID=706552 RepID=A0AAW1P9G0_9CHLO